MILVVAISNAEGLKKLMIAKSLGSLNLDQFLIYLQIDVRGKWF